MVLPCCIVLPISLLCRTLLFLLFCLALLYRGLILLPLALPPVALLLTGCRLGAIGRVGALGCLFCCLARRAFLAGRCLVLCRLLLLLKLPLLRL